MPHQGQTAVITGGAAGLGLEIARLAASRGMKLVLADVQADALAAAAAELGAHTEVLAQQLDVAKADQVEALGAATLEKFGAPHLVFNNAGVGFGGFIWEHTVKDWEWVLGVNLWGVAHGVRVFAPMMLEAAKADPAWRGRIINTASMAGIVNAPNMGVYNVTKHAVVSLTETLYQDLKLVTDQVSASVLCPYFVPTGIHESHRNRPKDTMSKPTKSQLVAQAMSQKAVTSGKVTAADVARLTFEAIDADRFYIFSHSFAPDLARARLDDVVGLRNPSDPFADKPQIGEALRASLRG
ncbi:MAG: SDR family oxidoreductase [Polyangiaceae bacterium]|jgi:NAD(P)-dependent dehydrogenase (short-subunit alcohol dehydrogenase family)|nr:SDR family oxidoreductase [Polyangiaceae bacterium]